MATLRSDRLGPDVVRGPARDRTGKGRSAVDITPNNHQLAGQAGPIHYRPGTATRLGHQINRRIRLTLLVGYETRMKVLVTGGAGFIGANLCRRLLDTPEISDIRVLDDLSTGFENNLSRLDVEFVRGSILDATVLRNAVNGCETIVHLAAIPSVPRSIQDPIRSHMVNNTGTLLVLETARQSGVEHVILSSSSSVYGANPCLPKSEDLLCMPVSPYAVSKLAAESYANAYGTCYDLPVLPFRLFNVFGPLQAAGHAYAAVVPAFISAALSGRPLVVHGDGLQSRDFTFVETVTAVLANAVVRRVTSRPVNLALGTRTTLLELIGVIEEIVGYEVSTVHVPSRPGDVPHSQADGSRLQELFPDVIPVDLRTGIRRTVSWFRQDSI